MADDAVGESALCSKCGKSVNRKAMIPVLAGEGDPAHVCVDCARALIPADYEPPDSG